MKAAVVLLFILTFSLYAQEYYRSNSLAMEMERIQDSQPFEMDKVEWLLEKKVSGNSILSTLYHYGIPEKSITREYNNYDILIYYSVRNKGILSEENRFGDDGAILEEAVFTGTGTLDWKNIYEYTDNGRILRIVRQNSEGEEISELDYRIRKNGSIRNITQSDNDLSEHRESWNGFGGILFMEERNSDSERELIYRNNKGLIEKKIRYRNNQKIDDENYSYSSGGEISKIVKTDYVNGESSIQTMNMSGQIVSEEKLVGEELIYRILYFYSDSKLSVKEKKGAALRERWEYVYIDDELSVESYYRQGDLEQKKTITDQNSNSYEILLYNHGEAFMNLVYDNDVKIREEYLSGGEIIRTRTLGDL